MPVRHDNDHGLGLAVGNEIVQDDIGAAIHDPAALRLTVSVKQVVGRVFGVGLVVVRGRVYPQIPVHSHRLRLIQHHPHLTVWHGTRIVERCAVGWNLDEAGDRAPSRSWHDADVGRIRKIHASNPEVVNPDLGRQRADSDAPDPIGASAVTVTDSVTAPIGSVTSTRIVARGRTSTGSRVKELKPFF